MVTSERIKKKFFIRLLSGFYDNGQPLRRDDLLLYAMRDRGWFPYSPPYSKPIPGAVMPTRYYEETGREWRKDIKDSLKGLGRL